ncbi:carbon-phosphorus lyase complex subunit PhnI [Salibacterium aidingense]|uniref:carbon-phosphorus lyase complex subunit PhnI n=1 Tax=Salibacterium aidingense TaxID=384933 RepID=UPI0003F71E89|nr:carbon-phosphorus lyase complex subunit PhnI [Salibacterium aidingense]
MGYVTVTGGQTAIEEAEKLLHHYRTGQSSHPLHPETIEKQMRLLVDRIMGEGGLYAPDHASLALKQAEGDPAEAAFLLRAYRSTLSRNFYTKTVDPGEMRLIRRISSTFKDIPGGQVLGPTYDYTHRLLNFSLREETEEDFSEFLEAVDIDSEQVEQTPSFKKVTELLKAENLLADSEMEQEQEPVDITREKPAFPLSRSARLQSLARGETGAMSALAYSAVRGHGKVHPTIGELRVGYADIEIEYPGRENESLYIGETMLTEVETVNSFTETINNQAGGLNLGYGLVFGHNELKAISMAVLEHSLATEGEAPVHDEEFVLLHIDSVDSSGFISHMKMPHYVTFQAQLNRLRKFQEEEGGKPEDESRKQ